MFKNQDEFQISSDFKQKPAELSQSEVTKTSDQVQKPAEWSDEDEAGIKAHAETYSFNIDSELFPQLTKEQQKLWRKEIEYACISGGDAGYSLAKDIRYKENHEVKEVNLEKELDVWRHNHFHGNRDWCAAGEYLERSSQLDIAKHFFELGVKAQKGEKV